MLIFINFLNSLDGLNKSNLKIDENNKKIISSLDIKYRLDKINNRRYYDQKNVDTLLKIQYLLKKQGMTIAGVKKILNNSNLKIDENNKKIISSLDIKYRLDKINNLIKNLKKD